MEREEERIPADRRAASQRERFARSVLAGVPMKG